MIIRIKNLRLRAIIGCNDWEREKKQDITINITIDADGATAARSDELADSVDYREITKRVTSEVEKTSFKLLERLADFILAIVMEDGRVVAATVEIDKPHALRFADSVSVESSAKR
ncbi:MAG: dihydroneopterin aldolase [Thermodesulfobacteriota bacterium]